MNTEPTPGTTTQKPTPQKGIASILFDAFEMFVWAMFAVFILFLFVFRLCEVDGTSMINTLSNGEPLLVSDIGYTPKQGDIIVFHLTLPNEEEPEKAMEKTLVKRVIATGGQELEINFKTSQILVDGVAYDDPHAYFQNIYGERVAGYLFIPAEHPDYDKTTGILRTTVPEGMLFVMGDNRNFSNDSRNPDIGFVDERSVLGKVTVRLRPFTVFT